MVDCTADDCPKTQQLLCEVQVVMPVPLFCVPEKEPGPAAPLAEQDDVTAKLHPGTPGKPLIVNDDDVGCPATQQPDCDDQTVTPDSLFLMPEKEPEPIVPKDEQTEETGSMQPLNPATPLTVNVDEKACPETQQFACVTHVTIPVEMSSKPLNEPGPTAPRA
ncbi:MAG: hypothetical protein DDT31_00760 [Syntrophomonadaceae bacterium]|nr:hypothetical protein [Bacillota bacterium]